MRALVLPILLASTAIAVGCSENTIEAFPEKYVGIGVELRMEAAGAVVVRVIAGGAAASAGVQSGDVILAIDGTPIRGERLAAVVDQIRGEPGTQLTLHIRTPDGERKVVVSRSKIKL